MTLRDLYTTYRIIPGLQMHQLRVAAIGQFLSQGLNRKTDEHSIVLAGLFHDMGNVIKSDLARFPQFLEPQGLEYWQNVKKEFIEKYGTSAHHANVAIAREIGLPESAVGLIDGVGFGNMAVISAGGGWEQKIVEYADTRVGPHGVMDLKSRLEEARARYESRKDREYYTPEGFVRLSNAAEEIERQLFTGSTMVPTDITDQSVSPLMEKLWDYSVS